MLHWSVLAVFTSFCWGCVNLADKTILSRYKLTPLDYLALDGFVGLFPLAVILAWSNDVLSTPLELIALAMISGLAIAVFSLIYFYALHMSNVVTVVILIQLSPVFSLVWGMLFLQESYESPTYFGMFLILLGAAIASVSERRQRDTGTRVWAPKTFLASLLMLAATFIVSLGFLVQKLALRDATTLSVFFWQRACLVLISLFIVAGRRFSIFKLSPTPIVLTSLVEVLNILGVLSVVAAYSQGPLGLVSFLSSLQPLWVMVLVWILGLVRLATFPAEGNVLRIRLVTACTLVILGLYLMRGTL